MNTLAPKQKLFAQKNEMLLQFSFFKKYICHFSFYLKIEYVFGPFHTEEHQFIFKSHDEVQYEVYWSYLFVSKPKVEVLP